MYDISQSAHLLQGEEELVYCDADNRVIVKFGEKADIIRIFQVINKPRTRRFYSHTSVGSLCILVVTVLAVAFWI